MKNLLKYEGNWLSSSSSPSSSSINATSAVGGSSSRNRPTPVVINARTGSPQILNITRKRALDAVRKEQQRQSREGIHDDELLATIYHGYNIISVQSAQQQGKRDAQLAAQMYV